MMLTAVDKLELALSLAREALGQPLACQLLNAAARFLELYRPPNYVQYNPGAIFRHALPASPHVLHVEPVGDAIGDTAQVVAITRLLIESAQLEQGAVLLVDVFQQPDRIEKDGVPCVALAFDGFGTFPAQFSFGAAVCGAAVSGDCITLTLDEVQARWTLATRGGRIDKAPNGLILRLHGLRATPEPAVAPERVRDAVDKAAHACDQDPESARTFLNEALDLIDGDAAPELADIKALVLDVARETRPAFESRGVVCEPLFASDLPPIPVRRGPMRGLFKRILAYAANADSPGAAVSILFDYDVPRRAIVFVATIAGVQTVSGHAAYMASLRRTVVVGHGGTFQTSADAQRRAKSEVTLTVSLPDPVGKALDAQIPGFDTFSDQSRKVLRLLNSGGPTPPPELLLEGVLEEELARWLLPQLEQPAAVNVAHEIAEQPRAAAVHSPERLRKAIDQIRKGKPKRELARPPFAAEIVWAYRTDPRRRAALAAENLSQSDLEQLAKTLATTPANPETLQRCLQLLGKRE
ncbi:MAG TPA: hypothetical protein VMZ06_15030 [Candidatus Bathyarchaeia archaeon]|nr:hypothetical protein [Candidatus Bathyarchaeia archaeon]